MYPAIILAGGASNRMGKAKATMLVEGVQMVVRVAHALRKGGCTTIYVAARDGHQRVELMSALAHLTNVEFILDNGVERSAKGGLKSALQICHSLDIPRVQLAPCDVPWIDGVVFERLRESKRSVVMPRAGQLQPLLSLVETDVVLESLCRAKMRDSLKRVLLSTPNEIVDFEDSLCFRNVNSPNDLVV
ncbi:MAG: NTP transferase domain-containing protein [Candidatus Thermoplasmatota archaeon]|nr:NTP transferase domain-containing protein [Candidatus Thermoplasmatota archaeon]